MNSFTESTWIAPVMEEEKKIMKSYIDYPPRKLQSYGYTGPVGRMIVIEVFERGTTPRHRPTAQTASQSRKSARHPCCLSTGHGTARSDITLSPQTVQQFTELDPIRRSFISRFTVAQLAGSTRSQSTSSPAAPKSP